MTKTDKIILELIRKALESNYKVDAALFQDVKWAKVIDLSMSFGLCAVCFDGVENLEPSLRPDMDNLMDWLGQTSYQETLSEHNWEVANNLNSIWAEAGISATVIKGRSIAQYYPKPCHRYSCDLDVFLLHGWEEACKVLENKGIKLSYEVYKEAEFTLDDVYVECHRYITPVRGNRNLQKVERYLRSLLESERERFEGSNLIKPSLMFTSILFIEHALGDLQQGSFSLKHVVDWVVLRKQPIHWQTFHMHCMEAGFDRFYALIDALADVVEGKKTYDTLSASHKWVFDELFEQKTESKGNRSWFQRRVDLFCNIIKNRRYYKEFGYYSMPRFLYNSLRTHFFDKEVKL